MTGWLDGWCPFTQPSTFNLWHRGLLVSVLTSGSFADSIRSRLNRERTHLGAAAAEQLRYIWQRDTLELVADLSLSRSTAAVATRRSPRSPKDVPRSPPLLFGELSGQKKYSTRSRKLVFLSGEPVLLLLFWLGRIVKKCFYLYRG